jgi:hypothetical protein
MPEGNFWNTKDQLRRGAGVAASNRSGGMRKNGLWVFAHIELQIPGRDHLHDFGWIQYKFIVIQRAEDAAGAGLFHK